MKMDLETLAQIVEEQIPTARVTCVTGANQIVATFSNRPDVEVALLSLYFQAQLARNSISDEDLSLLLKEIKIVAQVPV